MRRIAWVLLLLFAFAIPWEYSLDLGEPLGNVARIMGVLLLLAAVPAVLQAGRLRTPGALQWLVLAFYLWFCCTYFWTIDPQATLDKMRAYFQEMMIVWLVWEFAESPRDLRWLLRAYVAGSWVLAGLRWPTLVRRRRLPPGRYALRPRARTPTTWRAFSIWGFRWRRCSSTASGAGLAACWRWAICRWAWLPCCSRLRAEDFWRLWWRLAGCGLLLAARPYAQGACGGSRSAGACAAVWFIVPRATFERLATIPEQLQSGDLNQRLNIWSRAGTPLCRRRWWARAPARLWRGGLSPSRYGAQHGAFHCGQRRTVRTVSGCGHCGAGCRGRCCKPAGRCGWRWPPRWRFGRDFAGGHCGGEPHDLAAAGADCAGRAACRGRAGGPCRMLPGPCLVSLRQVCDSQRSLSDRPAACRLSIQPMYATSPKSRGCSRAAASIAASSAPPRR